MIAKTEYDKCFSTAFNGRNAFNFDGVERSELPVELARTALDFDISVEKCFDGQGREIPSLRHLKDNEGHFIPCHGVTDAFKPIQHREVFDYIVNDVMPKVPEMKLEMAGTIRGRSTGVFSAKFGDTFCINGDKSEQNLRLFFSNPTNGTGAMVMGFTHVRVVCQNTLRAAINEAKHDGFRVHHTIGGQLKAEELFEKYRQNNEVKDAKTRGGGANADNASLYSGFMAADKIALNRPCGNGAPRSGEISKQGVLGFRG